MHKILLFRIYTKIHPRKLNKKYDFQEIEISTFVIFSETKNSFKIKILVQNLRL